MLKTVGGPGRNRDTAAALPCIQTVRVQIRYDRACSETVRVGYLQCSTTFQGSHWERNCAPVGAHGSTDLKILGGL